MTMPPSERQQRRYEEHLTDAELNELVDGTLAANEAERAQTHLASCADCEERYRTLLATVSALKSAPSLMPRRSFQLTPEQAKLPEKQPSWFDRFSEWIMPGVPALRAATLAMALLLLSVTAIDVLTHRSDNGENAGQVVMRQAEPTQAAIPAQANNGLPTSGASIQESETDVALGSQPEAASGGAAAPTEASGPMVSGAMAPSDAAESEANSAADTGSADTNAEAPAAPAAAMPPAVPSPGALLGASESMAESAPVASPAEATTPVATATASPSAATAVASPTPAEQTDGGRVSVSRWRIAEFGLLLLLVWLGVTWFGRSHTGGSSSDESDPGTQ